MSSKRSQVQLTAAETQQLLAANLKVQIACNGVAGTPHLTTLFYAVQDEKIVFWTYGSSQKIKNLRRDNRIVALVEDGVEYAELRGVSITGTAEIVEAENEIYRIGKAVTAQMFPGTDLGELGEEVLRKQAKKRVGVIIHPDKVASWDHRKMGA